MQCVQANLRVTELRQELQGTKTQFAKMQRALQREVGEDVELSKVECLAGPGKTHVTAGQVLDEGSHWRGRAQQVGEG